MTEDQNQQCYGCNPADVLSSVAMPVARSGLGMTLLSMLSDVQEQNSSNVVRQALNRVKLVISSYLPTRPAMVAETAVASAEVGNLRELLAQATSGDWHQLPGRSLVIAGKLKLAGYDGLDVASAHGDTATESQANAMLIATLHNKAEALLALAELSISLVETSEAAQTPEWKETHRLKTISALAALKD